jgi:hypothetical protein
MKRANNVGFADFPWVRRANNAIAKLLCVSASVALACYDRVVAGVQGPEQASD